MSMQIVSRAILAVGVLGFLIGLVSGAIAFNGGTRDQQIWSLIFIVAGCLVAAFGYFMGLALAPYRKVKDSNLKE
jgi:hypothetical protein